MIDLKQELSNFHAIDLEKLMEDRKDLPNDVKNSIILYNKAIESLKAGSEDIAIIGLKKAVSMNPDFNEAINLLGLCYAYTKDIDMATDTFAKVVEAESNGIKALNYLHQINPGVATELSQVPLSPAQDKKRSRLKELRRESGKEFRKKPRRECGRENSSSTIVPSFLPMGEKKSGAGYFISFVAGALVVFILVLIFWNNPGEYASTMNGGDMPAVSNISEEEYQKLKDDYESLNEQYAALEKDIEQTGSELDYYKNVATLYQIDDQVKAKDYVKAAEALVPLAAVNFSGQHKDKYKSLCDTAYPKAAQQLLNESDKLIKSEKFEEALDIIAKVMTYGEKPPYMDRILYYTGKCHRGLNDSRSAIEAFQRMLDEYPDSGYAQYARNALSYLLPKP